MPGLFTQVDRRNFEIYGNKSILWISSASFAAQSHSSRIRNLLLVVLTFLGLPAHAIDCGYDGGSTCDGIPSCDMGLRRVQRICVAQ
jgi:hypothetical protein